MLLASTSPRRRELLARLGVAFESIDPGLNDTAEEALALEARARGADPARVAQRLALAKLLASLPRAAFGQALLAADTVIELDGSLLGKARDRDHAAEILRSLRGRAHAVHTGVALVRGDGRLATGLDTSRVRMRAFDDAALEAFLDTGQWSGKAGAYGVQDVEAAPLLESVEGSDSNVRGLPLELVARLLQRNL